jgi:hypothetical protein
MLKVQRCYYELSTALAAGIPYHDTPAAASNCTAATGRVTGGVIVAGLTVAAHNADGWSPVQNTDDGDSIDLEWGVEGLKTASAYNAAAPQATGDPF